MRSTARTSTRRDQAAAWIIAMILGSGPVARAQTFTIDSAIAGPITIQVSHAGPSGALVSPGPLESHPFRPPSIFSAPLPSGSGARALGLAGAFTALADDATAASWNPAGLIQLERPEASAVYRYSREKDKHRSSDNDFMVGDNSFDSQNLNYFSLAFPTYFEAIKRNAVVSLNYQEAYDFTQEFTASLRESSTTRDGDRAFDTSRDTQVDRTLDGDEFITITTETRTYLTTETQTTLDQLIMSDLLSDLDYEQEGVIAAITPAFALEITPKLSAGLALNYYHIDPLSGDAIKSRTVASYSGESRSTVNSTTEHTTSGYWEFVGTVTSPGGGFVREDQSGNLDTFTDTDHGRQSQTVFTEGVYEEINEFTDLFGYNATFGLLYTVSRLLTLGATVDLPWTAEAEQKKVTRNNATTYNSSMTRVLNTVATEEVETKDVEFKFPLYWAIGMVLRWTPEFYTTFDVSQTLWSDFSFKADGEARFNPLDGSPHGQNEIDDTWAARAGLEYLVRLSKTEVPLRCGVAWEQRPAIGEPDDFFSVSAGSGFAIGEDPGKVIIDVAYVITLADDAHGLVSEQGDVVSDVTEHQVFVSCIKHF